MLEPLAGERVTVEVRPGPGNLFVQADPLEFAHVLLNLVANAGDAIKHRGQVRLEASFARAGVVRVAVTDSGTGMDPATNLFSSQECRFSPPTP